MDTIAREARQASRNADASIWRSLQQKSEAEKLAILKSRADEEAAAAQVRALAEAKAAKERAVALEARAALLKPPQDETRFLEAISRARIEYKKGETDLQRGAARPARAKAICAAAPNSTIGLGQSNVCLRTVTAMVFLRSR